MIAVYIAVGVAVVVGILVARGRGSSSRSGLPEGATDDDIRALAQRGKKIHAIKWYRDLHGVDLREAVEEMTQQQ
ncbi:MAG: hypothetical protein JW741_06445 [Sedimentisphaerales bacterium]|nr:hypothetical protein [Sedimentisphaerales bacterium]